MLSRVADSLYWMSRYLERAEHTARVLDVNLHQMLDQTPETEQWRWDLMLTGLHIVLPPRITHDAYGITYALTFDRSNKTSILSYVSIARENARQVREQISSEMWEQINRLYLYVQRTSRDEIWHVEPHEFFQAVKEGSHLIQGITDSTMSHGEGWHFIQVGRFIERAIAIASLLDAYMKNVQQSHALSYDVYAIDDFSWVGLLKSCTAFEAYCKVWTANIDPTCILDFLALNADFPHSVRFSVDMVQLGLQAISTATAARDASTTDRLSGRLRAKLDYMHVNEILANNVHTYLTDVMAMCSEIHTAIQTIYVVYPIETVLVK